MRYPYKNWLFLLTHVFFRNIATAWTESPKKAIYCLNVSTFHLNVSTFSILLVKCIRRMEVYVASENYLYSVYICFHNTLEFYQLNVKKLIPNKLVNEKFTIFWLCSLEISDVRQLKINLIRTLLNMFERSTSRCLYLVIKRVDLNCWDL